MHTILGAGGVIGREVARTLASSSIDVRQVSRTPKRVNPSDEVVAADLLDATAIENAVAGSDVVYLLAGLKYSLAVWQEQWPRIMSNVIAACSRRRCKLVFFDNVYAYGRVDGAMTEETPFNPTSKKGEVRARIATTLLDAMKSGAVEGMIVRGADFYGPRALLSVTHALVFERIRAGKSPQWLANPNRVHTFTYTPDAGAAVARLAQSPEAFGQTWHAPTSKEALTVAELVKLACSLAQRPYKLQVIPRWMLKIIGLFVPALRENQEMLYQFDYDYRFDSTKIERAYGLVATPYSRGVAETLES